MYLIIITNKASSDSLESWKQYIDIKHQNRILQIAIRIINFIKLIKGYRARKISKTLILRGNHLKNYVSDNCYNNNN